MSYINERRQEERDRRRTEIVDAAEAVYADSGWDSVTMDQVARRARLSRALLYVYFQDKTDLHLALVERALDALAVRFTAAVSSTARGIDQVEAIGRAYVAFSRELPHYFDACARFQAHPTETGELAPNEVACAQAVHRVHEIMVRALNQGVADGSIRDDLGDPYKTAIALWALTYGMLQITATKGAQFAQEGLTAQGLLDHAFALALRTLRP